LEGDQSPNSYSTSGVASPWRRLATGSRTSRWLPLISDIEAISAEPSLATSRSNRSRPYGRVCTWFHSV
jgi:hypothetical protein